MRIADQLKLLREKTLDWAKEHQGTSTIAKDMVDLFSLLNNKPGTVRVVVMFHSEVKRGQYEEAGMVDRIFWIMIGLGRVQAMKLTIEDQLVNDTTGETPLFELVDDLREVLRAVSFDAATTEVTPDSRGMEVVKVPGWAVDSYNLEIRIGTQLAAVPESTEEEA